jgi:hypothetical protein
MASKKMVDLPGSTKVPYRDARAVAPAASDERLEVTLRIRPKTALPEQNMLKLSSAPVQQLTHDEYEETYGATAKISPRSENSQRNTTSIRSNRVPRAGRSSSQAR